MIPSEKESFLKRIERPHRRINPCFMTGKGCVYTEAIDRQIENRRAKKAYAGFMIVPFQPNVSSFFDLCFNRYLKNCYDPNEQEDGGNQDAKRQDRLAILRADQISRTGYVICEKICRKIQDSDFVVADISVANPNVFYELGLGFGANQKIIVVHHKSSAFGRETAAILQAAGCRAYAYQDLNPLTATDFPVSQYVWQQELPITPKFSLQPKILFFERLKQTQAVPDPTAKDISLSFKTHVMAAVGVAIDNVVKRVPASDASKLLLNYKNEIEGMRSATSIEVNEAFAATLSRVQETFCMIIHTGQDCDPMSYFWLGYCHALGKNVIPITVLDDKGQDIKDLAFDVRALWHMTFAEKKADLFAPELEEILYQMITSDFAEWSRRGFWDELLTRRGKVSIFTGALHNHDIGREMIGDWDLRAASELTSFFATHQYRAVIESPVYQIEFAQTRDRDDYLMGLEKLLEDKNCVIIASPDVSPLTELVLGRIYGIPKDFWFTDKDYKQKPPETVVAVKQVQNTTTSEREARSRPANILRYFYRSEVPEPPLTGPYKRGFESAALREGRILGEFVSQTDPPKEFTVHAHLVIARNPFRSKAATAAQEQKYLIVLNGVSGPATFAITHALTGGGVIPVFEAYAEDFHREAESEKVLRRILKEWETANQGARDGLQCLLSVTVGQAGQRSPQESDVQPEFASPTQKIFDWRCIKKWELLPETINSFRVAPRK